MSANIHITAITWVNSYVETTYSSALEKALCSYCVLGYKSVLTEALLSSSVTVKSSIGYSLSPPLVLIHFFFIPNCRLKWCKSLAFLVHSFLGKGTVVFVFNYSSNVHLSVFIWKYRIQSRGVEGQGGRILLRKQALGKLSLQLLWVSVLLLPQYPWKPDFPSCCRN